MLGAVGHVGSWLEVWLRLVFNILEAGKEIKITLNSVSFALYPLVPRYS